MSKKSGFVLLSLLFVFFLIGPSPVFGALGSGEHGQYQGALTRGAAIGKILTVLEAKPGNGKLPPLALEKLLSLSDEQNRSDGFPFRTDGRKPSNHRGRYGLSDDHRPAGALMSRPPIL